jgi:hypothetical protein
VHLCFVNYDVMNFKRLFGIIGGLVLLVGCAVAYLAATVGSEAGKMDAMLKADLSVHKPIGDIKKELTDAGYSIDQESPTLKATGPKHSLVVYTTWLTIELDFDRSGVISSYHLDRAS